MVKGQRVYVAQGIAQDHTILLLDEPLTGLDINSAKTIDSIIHDEPVRGCSVVLTTHDLEEARAADHVILTAGRVVGSGKPSDVLTTENLTNAYGLGISTRTHSNGPDPAHRTPPQRSSALRSDLWHLLELEPHDNAPQSPKP